MNLKEQKGWRYCSKCPLHELRSRVVLGSGNRNADIMFIGEGPGRTEDQEGRPFVGESGTLLNKFFAVFNINRADVFIDNVVACWPYLVDQGKRVTRKPSPDEIRACKDRIQQSIYLVDPTIIVALGDSALQTLCGVSGITKAAGEVFETTVPGWYVDVTYPVYAMLHPAYILRQTPPAPEEKRPNEKHPLFKTNKHFGDMLETLGLLNEAYYGVDAT